MKIIDTCLVNLYRKMKQLDSVAALEAKKEKCICGKNVVIYESADIKNEINKKCIVIGDHTHIRGELYTYGRNGRIEVGRECYIGQNTYIWAAKHISIGNRVLISQNCNIFDNDTHPKNSKERNKQYMYIITRGQPKNIDLHEKEIIIEDDVWIGANCTILKGCRIGKGSIIGTGTMITKDIPPCSIVYGNPLVMYENIEEIQCERQGKA